MDVDVKQEPSGEIELSESEDDDDSDYEGARCARRATAGARGTKSAAGTKDSSKVQRAARSRPRKVRREAAADDEDSHVKYRGVTRKCAAGRFPVLELQSCCAASTSAQAVAHSGVVVCRVNGRYEAQLHDYLSGCPELAGEQVYLGVYLTARKAARAYDLAALKFLGSEKANLNVRTVFSPAASCCLVFGALLGTHTFWS